MRIYIVSIKECPPKAVFLTYAEAERFIDLLKADREAPEDLKEYFSNDAPKGHIYQIHMVDISYSSEWAMERERIAEEEFYRSLGHRTMEVV